MESFEEPLKVFFGFEMERSIFSEYVDIIIYVCRCNMYMYCREPSSQQQQQPQPYARWVCRSVRTVSWPAGPRNPCGCFVYNHRKTIPSISSHIFLCSKDCHPKPLALRGCYRYTQQTSHATLLMLPNSNNPQTTRFSRSPLFVIRKEAFSEVHAPRIARTMYQNDLFSQRALDSGKLWLKLYHIVKLNSQDVTYLLNLLR